MSLSLRPLSNDEFESWFPRTRDGYAEDMARDAGIEPEKAAALAASSPARCQSAVSWDSTPLVRAHHQDAGKRRGKRRVPIVITGNLCACSVVNGQKCIGQCATNVEGRPAKRRP